VILESTALNNNDPPFAQFCVIGSGMGGATLAQVLAASGEDVLLIEAGSLTQAGEKAAVELEHVGRSFNAPPTRCIELGGTSNQWHGVCAPLDDSDFAERHWVQGSGWPIERRELSAYYNQAASMHEVPGNACFEEDGLPERLRERLTDIAFDESVVRRKLVYTRSPPMRWKGALERLARQSKLRCVLNAPALELILNEDGRTVDELIIGAGERTARIRARVFIVCCGALETPRLLLNSNRVVQSGIGNDSGRVGRNLLDHPSGHFSKIRFHETTTASLYATHRFDESANLTICVMTAPEQQAQHRIGNHYLWIRPCVTAKRIDDELLLSFLAVRGVRDLSPRQIWGIVSNRDLQYRILVQKFGLSPKYKYGDLYITTEQLPNPNSRVALSKLHRDRYGYPIASIDWRLSPEDFAGFDRYAKMLFAKGLRSDKYELARSDSLEMWDRTVASTAHHLGTAKMGKGPSHGVVDRNLQVFGHHNLFICDGSVFPTAGSANPSLTITALAIRLAEHLIRSRVSRASQVACVV
jgi:choline dehydrogenase-like flavoprotein